MEKIGEALSGLVSTTTLKATLDEIQTLLRPRIADPSLSPESRKLALEEKLASLTRLSCIIVRQRKKIEQAVDDLEEESLKTEDELLQLEIPDIPPRVLIQFVDVVDQANQYFNFKELVKSACRDLKPTPSPDQISRTLLLNRQLFSDFSKIGELQVTQAAHAIFRELHREQRGKEGTKPGKEDPALLDWIHNLVFKTRAKDYVMDQDPVAELKKMMKSKPYFFENYFLSQQLPVECTERLAQESRSKYSHLIGIMTAKSSEKHMLTSTATGARNKEKSSEKHMLTSTATGARNKEASNEKKKFASTASEMDTKSKRRSVMTGDIHMSSEKRKRL